MRTTGTIFFLLFWGMSLAARADYVMPPIDSVVKTAPIIVDATITELDPKTGAAVLKIHRSIRGAGGETALRVTDTSLSCTGGGPGLFGAQKGKRYVFILANKKTVYEETTFFEVVEADSKPPKIRYPGHHRKPHGPEFVSFEDFSRLIQPKKN